MILKHNSIIMILVYNFTAILKIRFFLRHDLNIITLIKGPVTETAYKKREEEVLSKIVSLLKKDLNPGKIFLFGSRAFGKYNPGSDFDIALDGKKVDVREMRELREKLEEITGLYKVDIVFLESVDKEFREIILRRGKILYERRA